MIIMENVYTICMKLQLFVHCFFLFVCAQDIRGVYHVIFICFVKELSILIDLCIFRFGKSVFVQR